MPRTLQQSLFTYYRERSCHSGRGRLLDALSLEFLWPTLATDAGIFAQQGHFCLSNKATWVYKQVPDGQFDPTVEPSVEDVAGSMRPLPETTDGCKCLLVRIDRASRWVEGIPIKGNTAENLPSAFFLLIWWRSCSRRICSDRGGNVLSVLLRKVYERLGRNKFRAVLIGTTPWVCTSARFRRC